MKTRNLSLRRAVLPLLVLLMAASALQAQSKRPLNHQDYDGWRNISAQTLSPDGKFVAYGLFPQEGDGVVVVREIATGHEFREPAGAKPEPPRQADPEGPPSPEEMAARVPTRIEFSGDSRFVVFNTFPAKAETDKAKRARKRPEDMPRGGMVVLDLTSGTPVRMERVRSFAMAEKSGVMLAYLHEPDAPRAAAERPGAEAGDAPAAPARRAARNPYGSQLVLRNMASGAERTFPDVTEYLLSKDGALLAYAVASRNAETNGAYAVNTANSEPPRALLSGRGKYLRLAFDEQQAQLAFLSDHDDAAAAPPSAAANAQSQAAGAEANGARARRPPTKLALYRWDIKAMQATELVSSATAGFRPEFVISEHGAIAFSRDGKRIFFGVAPPAAERDPETALPDDEKVSLDLWSYKDDYVQSIQKVRAEQERTRTFRAVYHQPEKRFVQLADRTMQDVTPSEDGLWALGGDNREYRGMVEYDTRYADSYLVNTLTGERKLLARKHTGQVNWSPAGKYALYYNGKDWVTVSMPDGKTTILTQNLGVNFAREDWDQPSTPEPYGAGAWTRDGKYVLIYDEFDVWKIAPDGSGAKNLTMGEGRRQHIQFRWVRMGGGTREEMRDPESRWIDPAQPVLLRAESTETRQTGFYRVGINDGAAPEKLMMTAHAYSAPAKARNAEVLLLTEQSFQEFPDLVVTDASFRALRKVSDANPQQAGILWGTAELVHYRNADGVALTGTLYKPENFDPAKKYPMLVYIYEKLSQNVNQYIEPRPSHSIVPIYYVSNGYLMLEPDIVYTVGEPGQSALKCVLPAVQSVVNQGFVDEKAIGIQGHSWGGYQIAYMVTQTNRFRAASAGAPVSNMTSAYDGIRWGSGLPRQFQYEKSQSRIGGTLWEMPMRYIENSPIFMADRVHTPLMILQNDADDAVPWYQGIEYFLALRRLGREVYMFTYNGEPHHLLRRPNQKDYTVRLQQYFDHFLKGAPAPEWMKAGVPYLDRDDEKERMKQATGVY